MIKYGRFKVNDVNDSGISEAARIAGKLSFGETLVLSFEILLTFDFITLFFKKPLC